MVDVQTHESSVEKEFFAFANAIDEKRELLNSKNPDSIAQDLFQTLFADKEQCLHLLKGLQVRGTQTMASVGLSQMHERIGDLFQPGDHNPHSAKMLASTGAQFISDIHQTAQECKVDLAQAFADLDSKYTDKKNSAALDIIGVINALLKQGYNVHDLLRAGN